MTRASTPAIVDPALKGRMLPGVAAIALFLLFFTFINVFAVLRGLFGAGAGRTGMLALCTLLVVGIFGLLKMRRWGLSLVLAGCLLLSAGYFFLFSRSHAMPPLFQGLFMLLFFLYLVRPEVRDRML
jgi:hypothetical protein